MLPLAEVVQPEVLEIFRIFSTNGSAARRALNRQFLKKARISSMGSILTSGRPFAGPRFA
jgi:hypothetical protein